MVKPKTPIGGYDPGPAPLWSLALLVIAISFACAWMMFGFILWDLHPGRWEKADRVFAVFIAYVFAAGGGAVVAHSRDHF